MQIERVENKRKSQVAAELLLQMVRSGKYPPGAKLPSEREIAEAMDVSRNTLREAVAALEIMGVLEVRRSHGIFVSQSSPFQNGSDQNMLAALFNENQDPFAIINARLAFEPGVAVLAALEAEDSELLQFGGLINEMREALEANQQQEYMRADIDFHLNIAKLTKSPIIISTMEQLLGALRTPLWRAMKKWVPLTTTATERLAEHLAIFSAMASRNEQEIWRSMREHLAQSRQRFLQ